MLAMANKIYGFIEVHDRYIRPNTLNMLNQFNIAVQKIPTIRAFRIGKKRIVKNGVVQEVDEDASEEAIEESMKLVQPLMMPDSCVTSSPRKSRCSAWMIGMPISK